MDKGFVMNRINLSPKAEPSPPASRCCRKFYFLIRYPIFGLALTAGVVGYTANYKGKVYGFC